MPTTVVKPAKTTTKVLRDNGCAAIRVEQHFGWIESEA